MAKKKAEGADESISGYFKRLLEERPDLLWERSNEELLNRWLADHPGETEVPLNVKQGLSNTKSSLRNGGKKKRKGKGKRGKAKAGATAGNGATPARPRCPAPCCKRWKSGWTTA